MTTPASCPGCGTKLEPEMEACPNCPMSFTAQAEGEPNPLRHESPLRVFIMPAAFFGLLGLAVWKLGTGLFGIATQTSFEERGSYASGAGGPASTAAVAAMMQASMDQLKGTGAAGVVGLAAALDGRPQPDRAAPTASGRVLVAPADGIDMSDGQGTISVVKEGGDAPRAVREWRLRGAVYDLVTLKPVAGAKLVFTDNETNARAETVSSAQGRYRAVLPPLREHGYLVSISKPGYAASYAGPESAGAADLDLGSRKELARQLARSVEAPTSLEPGSDAPFVTDFFLAPLMP